MRVATLIWFGLVVMALGCGGDDAPPGNVSTGHNDHEDAGSTDTLCVDEDEDGYGVDCDLGADCDDTDPTQTNACFLCAQRPSKGCPCEPGTKPKSCDPEDVRTTRNGVMGTLVCTEGYQYCRDGALSECEIIQMYAMFNPD